MVPAGTKRRKKTQKSPKAKPQERVPYQTLLSPPRSEHPPSPHPHCLYSSPALGLTQGLNDLRANGGYCFVGTMLLLAPGQTQLLTEPGQTFQNMESFITLLSLQAVGSFNLPLCRETKLGAGGEVNPGLTLQERPKEGLYRPLSKPIALLCL